MSSDNPLLSDSSSIRSLRDEILEALRDSIDNLVENCEKIEQSVCGGKASKYARSKWLQSVGRKAYENAKFFWQHTSNYSSQEIPDYLYLEILSLRKSTQNSRSKYHRLPIRSLENYWLTQSSQDINHGSILICSRSEDIHPKPKRTKALFTTGSRPEPKEVCNDSAIALLFLARTRFAIPPNDLYCLVASYVDYGDANYVGPLPGAFEDDGEGNTRRNSLEEMDAEDSNESISNSPNNLGQLNGTVNPADEAESSSSALPISELSDSMIVLRFPDSMPFFRTEFQYMDIWEPHRMRPSTLARCSLWGSWKQQEPSSEWISIMVFTKPEMASAVKNRISGQLLHSSTFLVDLDSHWAHLMGPIYAHGILTTRKSIHDAVNKLDKLKYENTAHPTIGYANACQMVLNHLEYYKRLMHSLQYRIVEYPESWGIDTAGSAGHAWKSKATADCKVLAEEITLAEQNVKSNREMVLQQNIVLQSRRTTVLTVLASVFIPASFVATLFGMNSSNWKTHQVSQQANLHDDGTKSTSSNSVLNTSGAVGANPTMPVSGPTLELFFIIAVPLSIITVFLPLFIVPLFTYFAKKASFPTFRNTFLWGWVLATFGPNLTLFIILVKIRDEIKWVSDDPYNYRFHGSNVSNKTFAIFRWLYLVNFSVMSFSFMAQFVGLVWWLVKASKSTNIWRSPRKLWLVSLWMTWVVMFYTITFRVQIRQFDPVSKSGSITLGFFRHVFPYVVILAYRIWVYTRRQWRRRKLLLDVEAKA